MNETEKVKARRVLANLTYICTGIYKKQYLRRSEPGEGRTQGTVLVLLSLLSDTVRQPAVAPVPALNAANLAWRHYTVRRVRMQTRAACSNIQFYVNIGWAVATPRGPKEFDCMPEGQLEEGSLLNERYRILRVIGQGGMGTVYQAEHERLNAIVAVKEIREAPVTGTAQQATMEQYEQEARFLVRLNHPNLPKVMDAFVDGDRFYLVMDFVDGVTLDNRLRSRGGSPIDPETVVDWAIEIANVLGYLHAQDPPIIFRDLKPSNVMVQPDGHIKLIDFGIARRFQPGATQDTALLGSVGYSPPEQFGRHQTDTRSDIYALAATMHHLLTAHDPTSTPFKFKQVDRVALGVPTSLSRLIDRCLAMEPDQRPPNVGAVSAELRAIHDDMHHVGKRPTAEDSGARIVSGKLKRTEKTRSKGAGSRIVWVEDTLSVSGPAPVDRWLRVAVTVLGILLVVGSIYVVHAMTSRSHAIKHLDPNVVTNTGLNTVPSPPGSVDDGRLNASTTAPATGTGAGANDSHGPGNSAPDPPASNADGTSPPTDTKTAQCTAEVVGASPDGKSVRLHVTGQINGKKDTAGMVAAYFYNADKTPLMAHDPKGAYATPSGQLFAEFTFQIDADAKPIDGLIDVPADQFTATNNVLFRVHRLC